MPSTMPSAIAWSCAQVIARRPLRPLRVVLVLPSVRMMPVSVAASAVIGRHVTLHGETVVGEYVILGEPFSGATDDELELIIGLDARIRSHSVIYAGSTIG